MRFLSTFFLIVFVFNFSLAQDDVKVVNPAKKATVAKKQASLKVNESASIMLSLFCDHSVAQIYCSLAG